MTQRTISWLQKVTLRGIEGLLADGYLLSVVNGNTDALKDYYESHQMAEQIYAQCCGWEL